jgi:hypothetical protein
MWQLLKADLMYNKFILIISYLLAVPFLLVSWELRGTVLEKARFILISMFVLAMLVIIIKNSIYSQEKRTRLFAELPVLAWRAGISRLFFLIVSWTGMLLLFWVTKWFLYPGDTADDPVIFWGMLYATGAIVIINGLYLMLGDLKYCFESGPGHTNHKTRHIRFSQILICGTVTGFVIYILGLMVLYLVSLWESSDLSFVYASFPETSFGAFLGHFLLILVLGAALMFIYMALIPAFGDGLKNIFTTSLIACIIGLTFVMAGAYPNISIKALIDLPVLLLQFFLATMAGANVYKKGHTGLIPRVMVIIGCILCVIFILDIFDAMKPGPVEPYFSMTRLNPAIIMNAIGLGISFLGVLTFRSRRSYVK